MMASEPSFSLRVDATNPGQFFACCGLLELAHRLWPGSEGWFEEKRFTIRAPERNKSASLDDLVDKLCKHRISGLSDKERQERDELEAEKRRLKREKKELSKDKDERRKALGTRAREGKVILESPFSLVLNWWQTDDDDVDPVKTWAGRQEIHKVTRAAQDQIKDISDIFGLFDYACILRTPLEYQKNKLDSKKPVEPFYFDARRFAHALDAGFSLDVQNVETLAHPAVELLSLIGLQRFHPVAGSSKWRFRYCLWKQALSVYVAAAVVCDSVPAVDADVYEFRLLFRDDQKRYKAFSSATLIGDKL